jgi:hypothetical protein
VTRIKIGDKTYLFDGMLDRMDPERSVDPPKETGRNHSCNDDQVLLTVSEAARMFGMSATTLIRWADRLWAPCCYTDAGRQFRRGDLESIMIRTKRRRQPPRFES